MTKKSVKHNSVIISSQKNKNHEKFLSFGA